MSLALVREALNFVDQDNDTKTNKKRRGQARFSGDKGQGNQPYKKGRKEKNTKKEDTIEKTVEKLLALSKPIADNTVTEKIIKRAVKGKPLLEKIEIKKEQEKSILFPEKETFAEFEKKYFCS